MTSLKLNEYQIIFFNDLSRPYNIYKTPLDSTVCRGQLYLDHKGKYLTVVFNDTRQAQNICIAFIQRRPTVVDAGPTLYKCYNIHLFVFAGYGIFQHGLDRMLL